MYIFHPSPGKVEQEDPFEFKASLMYVVRPCLENKPSKHHKQVCTQNDARKNGVLRPLEQKLALMLGIDKSSIGHPPTLAGAVHIRASWLL